MTSPQNPCKTDHPFTDKHIHPKSMKFEISPPPLNVDIDLSYYRKDINVDIDLSYYRKDDFV